MVAVARNRASSGFGIRLRELREGRGWTQADLAREVGVTYQAIAKYERNESEPTWPVVLRLAAALGESTEAFKAGDPDPVPRPISKRK